MSSNNVFFYLFKFISYQRLVCPDPNGHKFSFKKTELILRPVFALISQAPKTTEYIAIVMYIALFVYWHLDKDSWLEDWWFRFQEEDSQ